MNRLGLFNTSTNRTAFSIHGGGEAIDSPELSFKSTSNDGGEGVGCMGETIYASCPCFYDLFISLLKLGYG